MNERSIYLHNGYKKVRKYCELFKNLFATLPF